MRHGADLLFLGLGLVSVGHAEREGRFVPGQTQILTVQLQAVNGGLQEHSKTGSVPKEKDREKVRVECDSCTWNT